MVLVILNIIAADLENLISLLTLHQKMDSVNAISDCESLCNSVFEQKQSTSHISANVGNRICVL